MIEKVVRQEDVVGTRQRGGFMPDWAPSTCQESEEGRREVKLSWRQRGSWASGWWITTAPRSMLTPGSLLSDQTTIPGVEWCQGR